MIPILHLDDHILIVDKPAGLPVLPEGWDREAPWLVKILEAAHGRIWVVHRLDKVTSGVMLFARTADAHRHLNRQFELHTVEKVYHAILTGLPHWEEKTIRAPLRANVGHSHRTVVDDRNGKSSETAFRVMQRGQAHTLAEVRPQTGRTHQVRAHAYALGFPLLGDRLYGAQETGLIARPALHAYSLSFVHPASDERLTFNAPRPPDFAAALEAL